MAAFYGQDKQATPLETKVTSAAKIQVNQPFSKLNINHKKKKKADSLNYMYFMKL